MLTIQGLRNALAKSRKAAGLTQGSLAKKAGISIDTYRPWENSNREPSALNLLAILQALGEHAPIFFQELGLLESSISRFENEMVHIELDAIMQNAPRTAREDVRAFIKSRSERWANREKSPLRPMALKPDREHRPNSNSEKVKC